MTQETCETPFSYPEIHSIDDFILATESSGCDCKEIYKEYLEIIDNWAERINDQETAKSFFGSEQETLKKIEVFRDFPSDDCCAKLITTLRTSNSEHEAAYTDLIKLCPSAVEKYQTFLTNNAVQRISFINNYKQQGDGQKCKKEETKETIEKKNNYVPWILTISSIGAISGIGAYLYRAKKRK